MAAVSRIDGSLAERDVADLVQELHEQRWSGSLILTHAGMARSLDFREGRLVFASSTDPDDRLGELLLRWGKISLKQYTDAGKVAGTAKRLGTILVELKSLSPEELVSTIREQTKEIICAAFQWTEGRYCLHTGADPGSHPIALRMSTPDLIMEGIHRVEAWSRIERAMGGIRARYARAEQYEGLIAQIRLSLEKPSVLTELNEEKEVEAICRDSSLPDFDVCRVLWAFRIIGAVRRVDSPTSPRASVEEEADVVLGPSAARKADPAAPTPVEHAEGAGPPGPTRKRLLLVGLGDELFDMPLNDFLGTVSREGSPSAASQLLALAEEGSMSEACQVPAAGMNVVLPINAGRLLEEVASRLLGVTPRISVRLLVRLEVRLKEGRRRVMYQTENISTAGMLVRSDRLDPIGTTVAFELTLPGDRTPVRRKWCAIPSPRGGDGRGRRSEVLDGYAPRPEPARRAPLASSSLPRVVYSVLVHEPAVEMARLT
jgi:hypothetical protein